jgi:hypothetical protein
MTKAGRRDLRELADLGQAAPEAGTVPVDGPVSAPVLTKAPAQRSRAHPLSVPLRALETITARSRPSTRTKPAAASTIFVMR